MPTQCDITQSDRGSGVSEHMPGFRMEDFQARCPDVHRRSVQRDLRSLIEKQLLVAEGATNLLIYRATGKL